MDKQPLVIEQRIRDIIAQRTLGFVPADEARIRYFQEAARAPR